MLHLNKLWIFPFFSFQSLNQNNVPSFVGNLSELVTSEVQSQTAVTPVTISAIVDILTNVGNVSTEIVENTMQVSWVPPHIDTVTH